MSKNPNEAEQWLQKGIDYIELGNYEEAIKCFDQALEIDGNYVPAWNSKGNALGNLGRHEEAIACYDKAIEIDPKYLDAWINKGNAFSNLGRFGDALDFYDKAIAIDPSYADAWNEKGFALFALGKYEEAIQCYDKAIEIDPKWPGPFNNKGFALFALGKYEEAIQCYDKAIELNPNYPDAWNNKGLVLSALGKLEYAIECYDKAIEIDPSYADAWYNAAGSWIKNGDNERGLDYLRTAIQLDERNIERAEQDKDFESVIKDERFKALVKEGKTKEVKTLTAEQVDPNNPGGTKQAKGRSQARILSDSFPTTGPSSHITTDRWTVDDALGYREYAHAIARFLTHPDTRAPLCISIQAPWGGGKTSLMRMIQEELDQKAVEREDINKDEHQTTQKKAAVKNILPLVEEKLHNRKQESVELEKQEEKYLLSDIKNKEEKVDPRATIWFNAWKYQSTEQIWSGLADSIVNQIAERLGSIKREQFFLELHLRRHDAEHIRQKIYERVTAYWLKQIRPWIWRCLIGIGVSSITATMSWIVANPIFAGIGWTGIITSALVGSLQAFQQHHNAEAQVKEEHADEVVGEYVNMPDYNSNLGFIHDVEEDLQKVFRTIPESCRPMVIFIDDLDRCSPEKVAAVMEAVNLFLAGEFPNCIFIMGMDAEVVAAALEEAHNKVIARVPKYSLRTPLGWRFMDKFVQLPFVIPPSEEDDIRKYVHSLLVSSKSKPASTYVNGKEKEGTIDSTVNNTENRSKQQGHYQKMQEQRNRIKKLDEGIDNFSDQDPAIQRLILNAASGELSINPRELKRFINSFRFNYFIWWARKSRNLPCPSLMQLTRWTILSLKWPDVVRWLQWGNSATLIQNRRKNYRINSTNRRLKILEDAAGESDNQTDWQTKLEEFLRVKSNDGISWIQDENLWLFFKKEINEFSKPERLSANAGQGLY
jgi:tetratricopeptide (TPR) repeat protein